MENGDLILKYGGLTGIIILLFIVIVETVNKVSARLNPVQSFGVAMIGIIVFSIGVVIIANLGRKHIF